MKHRDLLTATWALFLAACTPQDTGKQAPSAAARESATAPATAPNEPPAAAAQAQSGSEAPPTVNGVYIDVGACPGEGCYLKGKIKAYEAVSLYDKVATDAAVIAQIPAGEWLEIASAVDRLVPLRGVVRKAGGPHAMGDVVYMLSDLGEGCSTVWNNGKLSSWCETGDPTNGRNAAGDDIIAWDAPAPVPAGAALGLWVEVKRANGQLGWLSNDGIRNFACTGYQDRDADCPPIQ